MCTYCICKPAYVFNIDICLIRFYLLGLSKNMTSQATLTRCYPIRRFDHGLTQHLTVIVNRLKKPLNCWVSVTFSVTASQSVC